MQFGTKSMQYGNQQLKQCHFDVKTSCVLNPLTHISKESAGSCRLSVLSAAHVKVFTH